MGVGDEVLDLFVKSLAIGKIPVPHRLQSVSAEDCGNAFHQRLILMGIADKNSVSGRRLQFRGVAGTWNLRCGNFGHSSSLVFARRRRSNPAAKSERQSGTSPPISAQLRQASDELVMSKKLRLGSRLGKHGLHFPRVRMFNRGGVAS